MCDQLASANLFRSDLPFSVHLVSIPTVDGKYAILDLCTHCKHAGGRDSYSQPHCDTLRINASHLVCYTVRNLLCDIGKTFGRH